MPSSLDERLSRIELMLSEIIDRLVELEMRLRASEEAVIAGELIGVANLPAYRALEAARIVVRLARIIGGIDEITRAIIEALAAKGPQTLRGLEREVRRIRGKASRRKISERVRLLEEIGVVEVERRPNRSIVRLKSVEESPEDG